MQCVITCAAWVAPTALRIFPRRYPALPRWANLFRAYGAGPMWRGELSRRLLVAKLVIQRRVIFLELVPLCEQVVEMFGGLCEGGGGCRCGGAVGAAYCYGQGGQGGVFADQAAGGGGPLGCGIALDGLGAFVQVVGFIEDGFCVGLFA